MTTNRSLRKDIEAFAFDRGPARLTFCDRLARENGWSRTYAARVAVEYKRFLYLVASGGRMFTPSEAVDQAWHLHLTYTQSYWEDLCWRIVGRPIHHTPTEGGKTEDTKFHKAYAATLARYESAFGTAPPADIWPDPATRFAAPLQRWVDPRTHLVLPKATMRAGLAAGAAGFCAIFAGSAAAAEAALPVEIGLAIGGLLLVIILIVAAAIGANRTRNERNADASGGGYYGGAGCGGGGKGGSGKGDSQDGADGGGDSGGDGGSGCGGGGGCGGS